MKNDTNDETNVDQAAERPQPQPFGADDLAVTRPAIEAVTIRLPAGDERAVSVKRLNSGETLSAYQACEAVKAKATQVEVKLKRCIVNPDGTPVFTDVSARDFVKNGDADLMIALLAAVHAVNPILTNA
jgi:hypothetical protein